MTAEAVAVQSKLALRTPRYMYYGHPIIRTAAKSPAKIDYRRLTEINFRFYGLSLLWILRVSAIKGVECSRFSTFPLQKVVVVFFSIKR